jgi:hypothetical protein
MESNDACKADWNPLANDEYDHKRTTYPASHLPAVVGVPTGGRLGRFFVL